MQTGANFKVESGRVKWWKPLISGDVLLVQDHEARAQSRQGTYILYGQYGNPFIDTLNSEISEIERNMRLLAEMKECALQDSRIADCIVNEDSITVDENGRLHFTYSIVKQDGGILADRELLL